MQKRQKCIVRDIAPLLSRVQIVSFIYGEVYTGYISEIYDRRIERRGRSRVHFLCFSRMLKYLNRMTLIN